MFRSVVALRRRQLSGVCRFCGLPCLSFQSSPNAGCSRGGPHLLRRVQRSHLSGVALARRSPAAVPQTAPARDRRGPLEAVAGRKLPRPVDTDRCCGETAGSA